MFEKFIEDFKVNGFKLDKLLILFVYRIGNYVYYSDLPKIIKKIVLFFLNTIRKIFIVLLLKVEIPFECKIGRKLRIMHPQGIILHKNAVLGDRCTIFHEVTIGSNEHSKNPNEVANIGNNVYIGSGAKIIGKVFIDDYVKVGANAVVVKDVPKGATVYCKQLIKLKEESF